jgi:signal transduction histidine kinase/ligand-binding sensor domain-containing protein
MPRAHIRFGIALALGSSGFAPSIYALDPSSATSQYVLKSWDAHSDLPSNSIHAAVQAPDGYLWFGTAAGLVRFDGSRFFLFAAHNTRTIREGGVSSLALRKDGSLCLGTKSGAVSCQTDGMFDALDIPSRGTARVSSLLGASDGSLWVASHGFPTLRWHAGVVDEFRPFEATGAHTMVEDKRTGAVWMGTREEGLVHYAGGEFTRFTTAEGLASDTVQALNLDAAGTLWIGTVAGLCSLRDRNFRCYRERDGLPNTNVSALLSDRDGNLWVGTVGGGLHRFRDGQFSPLSTAEGLSDDDVRCLLEDREGNLWVGTADGLNQVSDARFLTYGRAQGLRDSAVRAVVEGRDGSVWAGTTSAGVARLRDGVMTHYYGLPRGSGADGIIAIHEASDGGLWISTDDGRLFRIKDGRLTEATVGGSRPRQKVSVIIEDAEGPLFYLAGAGAGFQRLRDGHFVTAHPEAPRVGYLYCSYTDGRGTYWFGSSEGLVRMRGREYKLFSEADGLLSHYVRWVAPDHGAAGEPGLWLATYGGLAYLKDGRVRNVTAREGLPEGYLRLVLDDQQGHLWIASMSSIFRIDKREIFDLFAGRAARVTAVQFDTSDGLRTTEILLSTHPGFRAQDGRLWFATAKGVAVVDPARVSVDTPAPAVVIERLAVDRRQAAGAGVSEAEVFPPGRGEVKIEYAALSFTSSRKMRFRYRLESFDRDWVVAGPGRAAYYSSLPPGSYRFLVMASNRDGLWNGQPTELSFRIQPPFTRTPLFYALCAAALAALVAGAHRLRLAQMRARFAAIIGERTRIARELHDTMAQGLAGVGIQIDTALRKHGDEPHLARRHLQLARAMVRSSLAEVRRSIWVLRAQTAKGRDGLGAALSESLQQLTDSTDVQSRLTVTGRPRALEPEIERNLLRIAHEAVTNAVRHAGASRITVDLNFDEDALYLHVRDDGSGFDPEARLDQSLGNHFGLVGISERAQAMGGELKLDSRPGQGTEVVCRLPYHCRMVDPLEVMESSSNEEGASL